MTERYSCDRSEELIQFSGLQLSVNEGEKLQVLEFQLVLQDLSIYYMMLNMLTCKSWLFLL